MSPGHANSHFNINGQTCTVHRGQRAVPMCWPWECSVCAMCVPCMCCGCRVCAVCVTGVPSACHGCRVFEVGADFVPCVCTVRALCVPWVPCVSRWCRACPVRVSCMCRFFFMHCHICNAYRMCRGCRVCAVYVPWVCSLCRCVSCVYRWCRGYGLIVQCVYCACAVCVPWVRVCAMCVPCVCRVCVLVCTGMLYWLRLPKCTRRPWARFSNHATSVGACNLLHAHTSLKTFDKILPIEWWNIVYWDVWRYWQSMKELNLANWYGGI